MHIRNFDLAARNKNYQKSILIKLKTQSDGAINSLSTAEARQLYNWNQQVAFCYQRTRAFIRLKISKHGIVYGKIDPEHYIEDLVARWFLKRFPLFVIMIESKGKTYIISKGKSLKIYDETIETLLPKIESRLPENNILKGLEDFNDDSYWETYYDSQFIKSRKNKRYFLQNIPKKYLGLDSLKLEKKKFDGNKHLAEFT